MNAQTYKKYISGSDKPVLVKFWASRCVYCRRLAMELVKGQIVLEPAGYVVADEST